MTTVGKVSGSLPGKASQALGNPTSRPRVLIHRFVPARNGRTLWEELLSWVLGAAFLLVGAGLLVGFIIKFLNGVHPTSEILAPFCLVMLLGSAFSIVEIVITRGLWRQRVSLGKWLARAPRTAIESEDPQGRAYKIVRYAFCACFAAGVLGFLLQAITRDKILAGRIFITVAWLSFAVVTGMPFYTGRFKWKSGPLLTRDESPWAFYGSAIPCALLTMSAMTFLLWKAYTAAE